MGVSIPEFLEHAPEGFKWPHCTDADAFLRRHLDSFLGTHAFASELARRMLAETSTQFFDWVDHFILPESQSRPAQKAGFVPDPYAQADEAGRVFWHPLAQLPRVLVDASARGVSVAIQVDALADFQTALEVCCPIEGAPFSGYRRMKLPEGDVALWVVERRGTRSFRPDATPSAEGYWRCLEAWLLRPRHFADEAAGLKETEALARQIAAAVGVDRAAWICMEAERRYWESRNDAGRLQYWRQNRLGLGWANHDHHTFRSSRKHFSALIRILMALGFRKRERFFAGAEAGWGAQVMEQPVAGLVIFADVDLNPDEMDIDFSTQVLPEADQSGTVGLWCALHGESILQAGMHHLESQFDFDRLRADLKAGGVDMMPPFSDFPHLRQAFTKGQNWRVDPARLEAVRRRGWLTDEAARRISVEGAIGSHLENLQRRDGFKGFNQKAVSHILREVNPQKQAMEKR